jgi:hypothetical protein
MGEIGSQYIANALEKNSTLITLKFARKYDMTNDTSYNIQKAIILEKLEHNIFQMYCKRIPR